MFSHLSNLQLVLCAAVVVPVLLPLGSCAPTVRMGGTDVVTNHVFAGEEPVGGAVQVATNKKIPVVSKTKDGKTHHEERDCGQMVLVTPWWWRSVNADLHEYEKLYGPLPEKRDDEPPTHQPTGR